MNDKLWNDLDCQGLALLNAKIGAGAIALTKEGQIQTRSGRFEFHNGTKSVFLATVDDTSSATSFRGGFSAKAGALPTKDTVGKNPGTDLVSGQFVFVTESGTIAGIGGDTKLDPGSFLYFIGSSPTAAADWYGINNDFDTTPFLISKDVTGVSLATGAAKAIAVPTAIKTITHYMVLGSAGENFTGSFGDVLTRTGTSAGVSLKTQIAGSNLTVVFTGLTV